MGRTDRFMYELVLFGIIVTACIPLQGMFPLNGNNQEISDKPRKVFTILSSGAGTRISRVSRFLPSSNHNAKFSPFKVSGVERSTLWQYEDNVNADGHQNIFMWIHGDEIALREKCFNIVPATNLTALSDANEARELVGVFHHLNDQTSTKLPVFINAFCNGAKILASVAGYCAAHKAAQGTAVNKLDIGIVLDSGYANFSDVTRYFAINRLGFRYICGYEYLIKLIRPMLYWRYNPSTAAHPIDQLDKISADVPMAFISSVRDTQVPVSHGYRMAVTRARVAPRDTYFFKASYGKHAQLLSPADEAIINQVIRDEDTEENEKLRIAQFRAAFAIHYGFGTSSYTTAQTKKAEQILEKYRVDSANAVTDSCDIDRMHHKISRSVTAVFATALVYRFVRGLALRYRTK